MHKNPKSRRLIAYGFLKASEGIRTSSLESVRKGEAAAVTMHLDENTAK